MTSSTNYEMNPVVFAVLVTQVLKPNTVNEVRFRISDASDILRHGDTILTKYNGIAGQIVAVAQPDEDMPPVYWARSGDVIGFMGDLARHQIEETPLAVVSKIYTQVPEPARVLLDACVFPNTERTIVSIVTDEKFQGAHNYEIKPMLRYENGPTPETSGAVYGLEGMPIVFVKRNADGTWQPGIQSEQLLLLLQDRHTKLNAEFPTDVHDEFMGHLAGALDCLERRVRERTERGVMGKLEK